MSDAKPTPVEAFQLFTRRIGGVLRRYGFSGSEQNYRRERGEQWQALNIQRSQWRVERSDPITLYVNIGIRRSEQ